MKQMNLSQKIVSWLAVALVLNSCAALVVGGVAAGAASGAAVATDPRHSSGVFDDQDLRHKVEDRLATQVAENNIEVTSYAHNILLTGQVASEEKKQHAVTITQATTGVKKVYDYIEVGSSETAAQVSKDAYLTSMIKSNLLFAKGVSSNDVKVVTSNSIVYLLGKVDEYQAKKMVAAAGEIDGVHKVVNLFEIIK